MADRPLPEVPGVTHRWIDTARIRIHVAEAGSGPPLVLIHGWPQHWYMWRKVIPALARTHHVICPDLRGYGWSEAPPTGYAKAELGEDIIALLDALEIDRASVVGHDWGGMAAFHAVLGHPERVRRFAAVATGHLWMRPSPRGALSAAAVLAYQPLVASPGVGPRVMARAAAVTLRLGAPRDGVMGAEARESFAAQFREAERARAGSLTYRTFLRHEMAAILGGSFGDRHLDVPTLFIIPGRDPVVRPSIVSGLREHVRDLTVAHVAGSGHFVPEQAPRSLLAELEPFLRAA